MCIRDRPPHSAAAAPKVSEFPGLAECGGVPDHMIVNMGFVDMGAEMCIRDRSQC